MKKKLKVNILMYFIFASLFAFAFLMNSNSEAFASSGVCEDAAEFGVCIGDGAKCNIKKGILTFRCGKDPDGESIIIQ